METVSRSRFGSRKARASILGLVLSLLLVPAPVAAVDGVIEINQACAAGPGCFPSDEPGFPVRIEAAGSYRLTSNLDLLASGEPDPNVSAIEIPADDVTLDLNGFKLIGPTPCEGPCVPPSVGSASGIYGTGRRSSVHDGEVEGFPYAGVYLGNLARIHDVRVVAIGNFGVRAGVASIVVRCMASTVGGRGIEAQGRSVIAHNTSEYAYAIGISGYEESVVAHNRAVVGDGDGFDLLESNVILGNTLHGFDGIGLDSDGDCSIGRNVMYLTGDASLFTGAGSGLSDNVATSFGATFTGSGTALACNSANGVVTCPP
jgi:hypothetical protein